MRTDPFMMWFVDVFVEDREMKPSVYPIDAIVSEDQKTKRVKIVSLCGI